MIMFECCGYGTKLQLTESPIFSSFQFIPGREKEKNSLRMLTRLRSIYFPYINFLFIFQLSREIFLVIMFECCGYGSKLQLAESSSFSSFQLIPAREKEKKFLLMSTRLRSIFFHYIIFLFIFTVLRRNFFSGYVLVLWIWKKIAIG